MCKNVEAVSKFILLPLQSPLQLRLLRAADRYAYILVAEALFIIYPLIPFYLGSELILTDNRKPLSVEYLSRAVWLNPYPAKPLQLVPA
jgi:hypothetical protein